jgi:hypothetical protein
MRRWYFYFGVVGLLLNLGVVCLVVTRIVSGVEVYMVEQLGALASAFVLGVMLECLTNTKIEPREHEDESWPATRFPNDVDRRIQ